MSPNKRRIEYDGIRVSSIAGNRDPTVEYLSDHDLSEWIITQPEREKQEREVWERRARLNDSHDVKFALQQIKRYQDALEAHSKKWSQVNTAGLDDPGEILRIYNENAYECPCGQFKHWNTSLIGRHIDSHEEFKFFKQAVTGAAQRYSYLRNRIKDAKSTIAWYEKKKPDDPQSDAIIQRARNDLKVYERDLAIEFDPETMAILKQYHSYWLNQ